MKSSTAIGTIATDNRRTTGRFAPSPTGPLHLGSLVTALGSCLDARTQGGRWLLRIEDLDAARTVPSMTDGILRTLEAFGFEWEGPVLRQSSRVETYRAALELLRARAHTYECSCSRRDLGDASGELHPYPGTCRNGPTRPGPTAIRFRIPAGRLAFEDHFQGRQDHDLETVGDVVIRRRDGIFAYHLAVVVDDAAQGVTRIVRGADLLASTPWQIALGDALGHPCPDYGHLPLVTAADGSKLAKSRHSLPLDREAAPALLWQALCLLRQRPPRELAEASVGGIWRWALAHWTAAPLIGLREARLPV